MRPNPDVCRCNCGDQKVALSAVQHATTECYAPQTKILEGRTNLSECVSREALFKAVSTGFGPRNVEKSFETAF